MYHSARFGSKINSICSLVVLIFGFALIIIPQVTMVTPILDQETLNSGRGSLPRVAGSLSLQNANTSFLSEGGAQQAGWSVSFPGDVNGDGVDDILVGAPQDNGATGKVYVIYGNGSLPSSLSLAGSNVTFEGEVSGDEAGFCVAGAGDVNGDGINDILIGARNSNGYMGKVYLIYGNSSLHGIINLQNANASFIGETSTSFAGFSVAGAGDVNRDGLDDILIGAYGYPAQNELSKGKAYLIYGNESLNQNMGLGAANASFIGYIGEDAGISVAGAGDVNRDGYNDILIGAYGYNDTINDNYKGKVYLIYGNGSLHPNTELGAANASFIGENGYDLAGWSVAGAGDVNRDGHADILIGAYQNWGGGSCRGKTYLMYGSKTLTPNMYLNNANVSFIGENDMDRSGIAVAGAGDVNRDGFADILIGAANYPSDGYQGKVYLVYGNASLQQDTGLGAANESFLGETLGDYAGYSVAGGADINGDGHADLLVGAYGKQAYNGTAYLILGPSPKSNPTATFIGGSTNQFAGDAVACAGDVNGDGLDDILIRGDKVYLFLGNGSLKVNMEAGAANVSFEGSSSSGGTTVNPVAGAGDVNGDGFDDILIGENRLDSFTGKVYLIYGNSSLSPVINLANANATFVGEATYDYAGISVAAAGDMNGDGYGDIVIGADGHDNVRGKTYLIYGNNSLYGPMNLGAADASFIGVNEVDGSGNAVAGAGDVNRDGLDDIIIGARSYLGGLYRGKAYLVYGNGSLHSNTSLTFANASFEGEGDNDRAGYSVAGAGDLNRDGFDDILIGSRRSQVAYYSGKMYVVYGGKSLPRDLTLNYANASFYGTDFEEVAGRTVSGAGDVNRDGYDDFLVGGQGYQSYAGRVCLIYGGTSLKPEMDLALANITFLGQGGAEHLGRTVAGGGDFNGDGCPDILMGAGYFTSGGLTNRGRAYIVFDVQVPTRVLDLAVTTPTTAGFTLTWTAPGDDGMTGTVSGYILKYSTSPITDEATFNAATTYSTSGWAPFKSGGIVESRSITGLGGDTTYYFALKTYDEAPNNSTMSNVPSGTTLDGVAPGAISNLAAIAPGDDRVNLTWTAPGDSGMTGAVAGYILKYSTNPITDEASFNTATTYSTGGWAPFKPGNSQENRAVMGLSVDTTYYFALKAFDEIPNNSTISNVATITTTGGTDLIVSSITHPQDIQFQENDGGSHVITWIGTDSTTNSPTYAIAVNSGTPSAPAPWINGQDISLDVSEWTAGTYSVVITISDGNGNSISDTVIVTIEAGEPSWLIPVIIAGAAAVAITIFVMVRRKSGKNRDLNAVPKEMPKEGPKDVPKEVSPGSSTGSS